MSLEDDEWAMARLREWASGKHSSYEIVGEGSFRFEDGDGIVHRAWWSNSRWQTLCGIKNPTQKLQEKDPGAVTCIGCLGNGA